MVTRNLNKVIDTCFYPTPETRLSNLKHRPMGIGTQGLANVYMKMKLPFESAQAKKINLEIFECIYYNSIQESMELAKTQGPYETFSGSPLSQGKFQFDLWKEFGNTDISSKMSGNYDWETLRTDVMKYGVRNSLFTTQMPTASTSQILGNTESIEALTSNMYSRKVLAGEFIVLN